MKTFRALLAAGALLGALAPAYALDRVLGTPRIKDNGDIRLSDDVKIGRYQGNKFYSQPDILNLPATDQGSTGDLSGLSVTPDAAKPAGTIAKFLAQPTFGQMVVNGQSTTGNVISTSVPLYTASYGYQPVKTGLSFDLTGISNANAEHAGVFKMTSSAGGAGSVTNYKMALGAQTFCDGANSSPCWGMTTVVQAGPGYNMGLNSLVSHEFNLNNFTDTDCGDTDYGVSGHPCGLAYATTPPNSKTASFGFAVAGAGRIRNGFVAYSGGPVASDFRSYSQSQNMLLDAGQHANGINASGATYTGGFIIGPGAKFVVLPNGNVTAANVSVTSAVTASEVISSGNLNALFVQLTPITYGTLTSIRPCSTSYLGLTAYVTDSNTASFNAPVAGGGPNKIKVQCNGTAWVVG